MKRDRVVLDANVLISAVLFNGPPRAILELVIGGSVHCSLSLAILDELRDVLERPKFRFSPEQAFLPTPSRKCSWSGGMNMLLAA